MTSLNTNSVIRHEIADQAEEAALTKAQHEIKTNKAQKKIKDDQ